MRILTFFLTALLTTGCAFTQHDVQIKIDQPRVVPSAPAAEGTTLRLTVIDERDDADLGRRGAGVAMAKVQASGLIPGFVRAVEAGFRAKGYELVAGSREADAVLVVGLRSLKFEESMGYFTVGAEVDSTVLVEAKRGTEEFRNQYRASDEDRQFAISTGGGIDEQINLVLNEVISKLLSDRELDHFLTGGM